MDPMTTTQADRHMPEARAEWAKAKQLFCGLNRVMHGDAMLPDRDTVHELQMLASSLETALSDTGIAQDAAKDATNA